MENNVEKTEYYYENRISVFVFLVIAFVASFFLDYSLVLKIGLMIVLTIIFFVAIIYPKTAIEISDSSIVFIKKNKRKVILWDDISLIKRPFPLSKEVISLTLFIFLKSGKQIVLPTFLFTPKGQNCFQISDHTIVESIRTHSHKIRITLFP